MAGPEMVATIIQNTQSVDIAFYAGLQTKALIQSPYNGYVVFVQPEFGLMTNTFCVSLGYLLSPFSAGGVKGVPLKLDAAVNLNLTEDFAFRPRISLLAPAQFFSYDPSFAYNLHLTAGAGADLAYCFIRAKKLKSLISLGGTAAYGYGDLVMDIDGYKEHLKGFGVAGNASLSALYAFKKLSMGIEAKLSYGGKFIPKLSIVCLW